MQTQALTAKQPWFVPVEQGVGTIIHCRVKDCPHVVIAKRQVQAWQSLGAHCEYAHLQQAQQPEAA